MSKLAIWMAAAALACACGSSDDKGDQKKPAPGPPPVPKAPPPSTTPEPPPAPPSAEPATQELPAMGLQIDVPGTWTVKEIKKDHYLIKVPMTASTKTPPRLDIAVMPKASKPPKSVDAAAKDCPAKVVEKKQLEGGRFYYVCEQAIPGRTLRNFRLIMPQKSGDAISCVGVADVDAISALLDACVSLRAP
jgi:hypothetical protein